MLVWLGFQTIQDDFVEMRKTDPKSMTVDDFHTLLSLTRYVACVSLVLNLLLLIWCKT